MTPQPRKRKQLDDGTSDFGIGTKQQRRRDQLDVNAEALGRAFRVT